MSSFALDASGDAVGDADIFVVVVAAAASRAGADLVAFAVFNAFVAGDDNENLFTAFVVGAVVAVVVATVADFFAVLSGEFS